MFSSRNYSASLNPSREGNKEEVNEKLAVEDNGDVNKLKHELESVVNKEPMFQKPLTPSDVGKLNRLVIPKQHAVNYFPTLVGGNNHKAADTSLSFEDELGKCWRFRYSYWNSSQNYVLTKGWSRFVRENRLVAGDVVLFERHRLETDRFFIVLRRRAAAAATTSGVAPPAVVVANNCPGGSSQQVSYSAGPDDDQQLHAGTSAQNEMAPVGGSKRLRLFGVNVKCQPDDEFELPTTDCGSLSRAKIENPE